MSPFPTLCVVTVALLPALCARDTFAHAAPGIVLTKAGMDLYNRYFPERWQVAVVLHRRISQPVRLGLFVRDPDSGVKSSAPAYELTIELAREPSTPNVVRRPIGGAIAG